MHSRALAGRARRRLRRGGSGGRGVCWPPCVSAKLARPLTTGQLSRLMTMPQLELHDANADAHADARAAAAGGPAKRSYVQRIFSEIAPRYDLLNRLLSGGIDRSWRRAAIAALGVGRRPGGTYLDLFGGPPGGGG